MPNIKITKPPRSQQAAAWLKQEIKEQKQRYKHLEQAMNIGLESQREIWYAEFNERIQTRGFYWHADNRRKIKSEEIFKKPKRKSKVVF